MQKRFLSLLLILTLILSTPIYSYAQSGKSLPAPENVNVYYDQGIELDNSSEPV